MKKHGSLIKLIALFILATFYFASIPTVHSSGKEKQVVGWVEVVTLLPENLQVKAKLDTGARNSSLNATNIVEFKRQGETFVRFELTNWKGRVETKEAQVIRVAKIKQHNDLCLGNIFKQVEVNLVNRSNFNYPMLIGRSFLKGDFVIDPARTYTVPANCRKFVRDE